MADQRFRKEYHVRRGADFKRAYDRRCRASDKRLLVFGYPNDLPYSRLGLSVSRAKGNAVVRNRWKRLIREAFRLSREELPVGIDLIVIPREGPPELAELQESICRLATRLGEKLL
jgi:ribonuclease P protein component